MSVVVMGKSLVWREKVRRGEDKGIEGVKKRRRERGKQMEKMWQRWVIAEGIEMVQLHLMVSQRGVIASEWERKKKIEREWHFFFSLASNFFCPR